MDTEQDTATPDTEQDTATPDTEQGTERPDNLVDRAELDRVIAQRDKIKAELRALQAGQDGSDTVQDKPDSETDTLRTALRRTAASAVLSGRGITEDADVSAVLSVVSLDTLPIGEDGQVDTTTLTDTLDTLARVFGKGKPDTKRVPSVDTRRGSRDNGDALDEDTKRYRKIMGRG